MVDRGTVDRDGFGLEWVREGAGIPMIIVGSQHFYRRYYPQSMRDQFDMVFCDSRQWVPTPQEFDLTTITSDTFADDIEAVRQATGLDHPIVMGQSQHGAIALEYALRYADVIRGAIAVAAVPPGFGAGLEPAAEFFQRDAGADRLAAHERNRTSRRVPESVQSSRDFIDDYVSNDAMNYYDLNTNSAPLWEGVEINLPVVYQLFAPSGLGGFRLVSVDIPILLILGRYDYGVPHYQWDGPRKEIHNLTYKLYERSGHHPPYEEPTRFTADVFEWAQSLTP